MSNFIYIMGKSASGKDTIYKRIKEQIDVKTYVLYTTRPIRSNECNGREYYFIDEITLEKYRNEGKVIEERNYNTVHGVWYYCTIDDKQVNIEENNYLLIVTLEAYKDIALYFGEENVIPFYIELDDGVRLERALKREREEKSPNYDELCRRFLADSKDFSHEKLKACNINKSYVNDNLSECINTIKKDMLELMINN